jgi:8-hydroxy-5-deazaflavin:NADPH oxidoreductase
MNYAIIGSGKIGTALARHFARHKIQVAVANTRGPQSLAPLAQELGDAIVPQPLAEALQADAIILAVPFASHPLVAQALSDWWGKIVIDAMNAFGVPPEVLGDSSSSELVARAFPGAKVVKAFNHLPAATLGGDPAEKGGRRVVFLSSDDRESSASVAALAEQLGFAAIELGDLGASGALLSVRGPNLGPLLRQNLIKID